MSPREPDKWLRELSGAAVFGRSASDTEKWCLPTLEPLQSDAEVSGLVLILYFNSCLEDELLAMSVSVIIMELMNLVERTHVILTCILVLYVMAQQQDLSRHVSCSRRGDVGDSGPPVCKSFERDGFGEKSVNKEIHEQMTPFFNPTPGLLCEFLMIS